MNRAVQELLAPPVPHDAPWIASRLMIFAATQ
jgi:hypothetical protein